MGIPQADFDEVASLLLESTKPIAFIIGEIPDIDAIGTANALERATNRARDIHQKANPKSHRKQRVTSDGKYDVIYTTGGATGVLFDSQDPLPANLATSYRYVVPPEATDADWRPYIDFHRDGIVIVCDESGKDRLGRLSELVDNAAFLVVIDHHQSNQRFGHFNLVDPDETSSTMIAHRLIAALGVDEPNIHIDNAIAAGLVGDTRGFDPKYPLSPYAQSVRDALTQRGVNWNRLIEKYFPAPSADYTDLLSLAVKRAERDPQSIGYVSNADFAHFRVEHGDGARLGDDVANTLGRSTCGVLIQTLKGAWHVQLRSAGKTNVGDVAQSLGGGGHRLEAGAFLRDMALDTALALVHKAFTPPPSVDLRFVNRVDADMGGLDL